MVGWIKMKLGTKVGLVRSHIVLDGDPAPLTKKRGTASPQFSAHVYCGQMAGWIKMPLGMEVGLGWGHIVLDGDPPLLKRGTAPNFRPMTVVAKQSPISATAEHLFQLGIERVQSTCYHFAFALCCRITRWRQTCWLVSWLEFNISFQHKYGYIRDEGKLVTTVHDMLP